MSEVREIVVGAVIVDNGRVLAARRTYPPDLAGAWEFPGGKVKAGECPQDALRREIREELGIELVIGDEVVGERPWIISERFTLRLFAGTVGRSDLVAGPDHDALRWLTLTELGTVEWLPSDREALVAVGGLLRALQSGSHR